MSQVRVRDNDADVDDGNGFGVSSNDHSGRDQIRGDSVVTNGTIRGGARRSRWPTTTSRVHGSQGIHHAGGAKIIELTPYRERYRNRVLAEVGLGDDEDGDDGACSDDVVVGREQHEKDRRRKKQKKQSVLKHKDSSAESSDDAEFDDILHDDNDLEYESFRHSDGDNAHTWHADSATRITVKLLWIALAVAAFIFIFREDDEFIKENIEDDVEQNKVPYSYKGYKDARIPDDDIAQYGGGVLGGEALGIDSENYKTIVDDGESDIKDDESEQSQITQQQSHHEPTGIVEIDALWEQLDGYSDMSVPYDAQRDLPVFWHVPKSGGTTLQDLLMHCVGMVGANEIGAAHSQETGHLEIVHTEDGNRYVNVDMSNPSGIAHAAELGFGSSGLADVVITSWLDQAASVFDSDHKGRCFTLLRHPIRRAVSLFYYLKDATWEHTYSEAYKNMTIEEYATSDYSEDNWMTRFLCNEMSGLLTERHLDLAKQVLESKCLVGLMEEFMPSFKRFNKYFKWSDTDFDGPVPMKNRGPCVTRVMKNPDNAHSHQTYDEGGQVWNLLMQRNRYDMSLYDHAVHLFHDVQSNLVRGR